MLCGFFPAVSLFWDPHSLTSDDRPEHVQTQIRYPQTLRVFLGCKLKGPYSIGYHLLTCSCDPSPFVYSIFPANGSGPEISTSFAALDREGLLGKVVLMRDLSREPSPDLRLFGVLCLDSRGIFMAERLAPVARRLPSLLPVPLSASGTVTTHGGLISPQTSESQFSATNNGFKPIDPTKVRRCLHLRFSCRSCRRVCGVFFLPSNPTDPAVLFSAYVC